MTNQDSNASFQQITNKSIAIKNKPDQYIKILKTNNLSHLSNSTYAKNGKIKPCQFFCNYRHQTPKMYLRAQVPVITCCATNQTKRNELSALPHTLAQMQLIAQLNLFAFGFLFVELVVATPVEWWIFVSVTPAATKSILDSFFSSKYPFYVYFVHDTAKNRAKNRLKP